MSSRLWCASGRHLLLGILLLGTGLLGAGCGASGEMRSSGASSSRGEAAEHGRGADQGPVLRLAAVQGRVEQAAQDWYGTPYKWGGESKEGVDCSAFVKSVYKEAFGVELPRVTETQVQVGVRVPRDQIRPGDLVFFHPENEYNHVGVYIGEGTFAHASSNDGVTTDPIHMDYWRRYYWTARRPLTPSTVPDPLATELLAYRAAGADSTARGTRCSDVPPGREDAARCAPGDVGPPSAGTDGLGDTATSRPRKGW